MRNHFQSPLLIRISNTPEMLRKKDENEKCGACDWFKGGRRRCKWDEKREWERKREIERRKWERKRERECGVEFTGPGYSVTPAALLEPPRVTPLHDTATTHHNTPLHYPLNHSLDNHMLINFPLSPGHIHHVNSKYHHTAGCSHPSRNRLDNHNYSFFGK